MYRVFLYILLMVSIINANAKDVIDKNEYCKINWTKGYIYCKGESAEGQKKFKAKRSAVVIAQRNLLELVKGIRIDSEITIENGMMKSDIIRSSVNGVVKGAEVINNKFNRKRASAIATLKLHIGKDLRKALMSDSSLISWNEKIQKFFSIFLPTQLYAKEVYAIDDKQTLEKLIKDLKDKKSLEYIKKLLKEIKNSSFSGLLIDARDASGFEVAMNVKLVDKNGKEIYPGNYVSSKQFIGKNGVTVGLDFDIGDAKKNKRVFDSPLLLKANSIYKKRRSDIVLDDESVEKLNLVKKSLKKAKVVVVVPE